MSAPLPFQRGELGSGGWGSYAVEVSGNRSERQESLLASHTFVLPPISMQNTFLKKIFWGVNLDRLWFPSLPAVTQVLSCQ